MSDGALTEETRDPTWEGLPASASPPRPRRWLRWLWLLLPVLAATVLGVAYVLVALRREPEFYRETRAALADVQVRETAAAEFETRTRALAAAVQHREPWRLELTEQQINAWLLTELPQQMDAKTKSAVSEPLVKLTAGRVQVGARIDTPQYKGVVSCTVLPALEEPNTLALSIDSIRAGDLPVPAGRLIAAAMEYVDQAGWRVRIETEPQLRIMVPLTELKTQMPVPNVRELTVGDGSLTLTGEPQ